LGELFSQKEKKKKEIRNRGREKQEIRGRKR
jgi:hypothetical protein